MTTIGASSQLSHPNRVALPSNQKNKPVKPFSTVFKMKSVTIFAMSLAGPAVGVAGAATTTFPEASGETALPTPMVVSGSFDGGMKRYNRNRKKTVDSRDWTPTYVILQPTPARARRRRTKTRPCSSSRTEEASPTLSLARLKVKVFTAGALGPYH